MAGADSVKTILYALGANSAIAAAELGLVFALFAVALTMITGNPVFDALDTLAIGALLIIIAFENDFRHAFPQVIWLFVEPDIAD